MLFHRIKTAGLFRLENTCKVIKSDRPPNTTSPLLNHVHNCSIHPSLKCLLMKVTKMLSIPACNYLLNEIELE